MSAGGKAGAKAGGRAGGRAGRGFTLIELTLAMMLLSVGLLALVGALARALEESRVARSKHAALRYLETVADSVVSADVRGAGVAARPGARLEWRREPCAAGECVRVRAILGAERDTLEIVSATVYFPPR